MPVWLSINTDSSFVLFCFVFYKSKYIKIPLLEKTMTWKDDPTVLKLKKQLKAKRYIKEATP